MDALPDRLVPDTEAEEAIVKDLENEIYNEEHAIYFPPELVHGGHINHAVSHHCYLIELKMNLDYNVPVHNVILIVNTKLDLDPESSNWDFEVSQGSMGVEMKYLGEIGLTCDQVHLCRMFQVAVFRALLDHNFDKLKKALDEIQMSEGCAHLDYLILPSTSESCNTSSLDWSFLQSVLFQKQDVSKCHNNCSLSKGSPQIHTKNGLMCHCMLESCLLYTPHNGRMYCTLGFIHHLNSNSEMSLNKGGDMISYKDYFKTKHGTDLCFENEALLYARQIHGLQNFLYRQRKQNDSEHAYCELPPELCCVIISPIPLATFYTFSLVPLIMNRIESLLMAVNLQRIYKDQSKQNIITPSMKDHGTQNVIIPTTKILEAITTKKCQEAFHLESLETLGDSFLKYAVSQQLFKTHQDDHEGILSSKREKIISNSALCKLGCKHKIPGFIRDQIFEPKNWPVPGDPTGNPLLEEEWVASARKMYKRGTQKLTAKRVADVVEALIGAFLSCGGEVAALSFLNWLGINVDFSYVLYNRQFPEDPRIHVNVKHLESLLKYSFCDPSLLVEALTHGSYMKPEIPRCHQRLEFLGDSVLDHLITLHLYSEYTGLSPGMLTDLRSASVNNECYAYSAFRVELHKHILHASKVLNRDLVAAINSFEQLHPESAFGWEIDIPFPKVLADVIESLAGAIFVDSGYNKDIVFESMKPILEPLITPETLKIHPVQELEQLCQKHHFLKKKHVCRLENGKISHKLEVEANGNVHSHTCTAVDKKFAQKNASKAVLKSLKDSIPGL